MRLFLFCWYFYKKEEREVFIKKALLDFKLQCI